MTKFGLLMLLGLIAFAVPSLAATRYVSTTGTNSGGCTTLASPCLTVAYGISQMGGGDTLYLCAGACNGSGSGTFTEGNLNMVPGGSSWSAPTTIAAYPGETVTIANPVGTEFTMGFVGDFGARYIIADHIIFDGYNGTAGSQDTMVFDGNADHIRIQNSEIKNGPSNGINIKGHSNNIELINDSIHDNGRGGSGYAVYVRASNITIDGCDIYNNTGYGLHLYSVDGGVNNNTVRNNKLHNNGGHGLIVSQGTGNSVYNNDSYSNVGGIRIAYGATSSKIYNNTFYGNTGAPGIEILDTSTSADVRNNIAYNNSAGNISNAGVSTTLGSNLTTNPTFIDAASNDFRIQTTSAAKDAGVDFSSLFTTDKDGNVRPQGSAWDIGSHEFVTGTGPPPTGVTPLEDFAYTAATDIAGGNTGTHWGGMWVNGGSGTITSETAPAGSFSGGTAARSQSLSGGAFYYRQTESVGTGTFTWQMRSSTIAPNSPVSVSLGNAANPNLANAAVYLYTDGTIEMCQSGGTRVSLGNYSANQWYLIDVALDSSGHSGAYRARVDKGTWSSWVNMCETTATVDRFYMVDLATNSHTFWVDTIGAQSTALTYSGQPPSSTVSGATFSSSTAITYSDGVTTNTSATNSVTVALCSGSPAVTLGGTLTQSAIAGVATFNNLTLTQNNGATGITLCATASGLTGATSNSIMIPQVSPPTLAVKLRIRARTK